MKKKNKILALIMAFVVCSSLILSLCSFATVESRDYTIYSPRGFTIDVEYRSNSSSNYNGTVYGFIPDFNQILVDSNDALYSYRASSYEMADGGTLVYGDILHSRLDSNTLESLINLVSSNSPNSFFTGRFVFNGLMVHNYLAECFISFGSDYDFSYVDDYSITCTGYYVTKNQSLKEFSSTISSSTHPQYKDFSWEGDTTYCDASRLLDYWAETNLPTIDVSDIYLTQIDVTFSNYRDFDVVDGFSDFYVNVPLISEAANLTTRKNLIFDIVNRVGNNYYYDYGFSMGKIDGLEEGYDNGYAKGSYDGFLTGKEEGYEEGYEFGLIDGYEDGALNAYNKGLSDSPFVWGSFTDFLKTTVAGFLDFEFVPGISLGGILSILLGLILVFTFLRIFAGG